MAREKGLGRVGGAPNGMEEGKSGGRHGSGHSSKNSKPGYMSHIPAHHLDAHSPHSDTQDNMSHQNLLANCGGGHEEEA